MGVHMGGIEGCEEIVQMLVDAGAIGPESEAEPDDM